MGKTEIVQKIKGYMEMEQKYYKSRSFPLTNGSSVIDYIYFPNGGYIVNKYNEYMADISDDVFEQRKKRRIKDIESGCIGEIFLQPYMGHNFTIELDEDKSMILVWDDVETEDEVARRIFTDILQSARDCYRKEYIAEHGELKMYDINCYYGKWIENIKPKLFHNLKSGDFVSVKIEHENKGGYDIAIGWYDEYCKDNDHNIHLADIEGNYRIAAWCALPKVHYSLGK